MSSAERSSTVAPWWVCGMWRGVEVAKRATKVLSELESGGARNSSGYQKRMKKRQGYAELSLRRNWPWRTAGGVYMVTKLTHFRAAELSLWTGVAWRRELAPLLHISLSISPAIFMHPTGHGVPLPHLEASRNVNLLCLGETPLLSVPVSPCTFACLSA